MSESRILSTISSRTSAGRQAAHTKYALSARVRPRSLKESWKGRPPFITLYRFRKIVVDRNSIAAWQDVLGPLLHKVTPRVGVFIRVVVCYRDIEVEVEATNVLLHKESTAFSGVQLLYR